MHSTAATTSAPSSVRRVPRLLAISGIDRALDDCRKVLDHSRKVGLPVAFIRMLNESAFFQPYNAVCPLDRGF
jgi:hypothetical protein